MSEKTIVSYEIGNFCIETLPCIHEMVYTYSDGTVERREQNGVAICEFLKSRNELDVFFGHFKRYDKTPQVKEPLKIVSYTVEICSSENDAKTTYTYYVNFIYNTGTVRKLKMTKLQIFQYIIKNKDQAKFPTFMEHYNLNKSKI